MEIHQLLPGMHEGDAISRNALALKGLLRSWGHASEIYAKDISAAVAPECQDYRTFRSGESALTIYHYSLGCEELTRLFQQLPGKRLLLYHNITPHSYVAPYNRDLGIACSEGRAALPRLCEAADLAVGDSEYNCQELADHGFQNPGVLPLLLDFGEFDRTPPCPATLHRYGNSWTNFLFVGRVSPHKCQHDLLRVFAHYNGRINRRSRLFVVGSWRFMDGYLAQLQELAHDLDIEDHVFFTGQVSTAELIAYYRLADVFECLSEHEGVCVPLLEAMHHEIPIIAYAATGVPETLGDAGLLVTRKDHALIAELAHLLSTDHDLRDRVVRRQGRRLADFRPEPIAQRFRSYLEELMNK